LAVNIRYLPAGVPLSNKKKRLLINSLLYLIENSYLLNNRSSELNAFTVHISQFNPVNTLAITGYVYIHLLVWNTHNILMGIDP
jgi:hypothetical protein